MNRSRTLLLGLVGFILILTLAVYNGAEKITDDLTARGRSAFDEQGLQWVELKTDGRNLLLSGTAPSEKAVTQALKLAEGLPGVEGVYDNFSYAANSVKTPKPTADSDWSTSIKAQ
ncbi:BON domain-containing protein [Sedimenticola selenatireducens]|uniref:BON domain-containing protein n=1 Tax=Sedimenticola selenatireducens TaxID=191960 RepID=A0A558DNQ9_9GAMM|nr:BON domain-containing protein [Sedimenticola selenatireducens]TVO78489.1 BON domain-containing protein [Sedimenticola selenatireducens]TVT62652.1 MAG: BON domain-containing protein [Sedimenticola selenatireducens]